MSEIEQHKNWHTGIGHDKTHVAHRPYWKRAHRDWRVWVSVLFIFAAMSIYIWSDNLRWWPKG